MNNFTKVNILKLIYKNKIMLWGIDLGGTKIEGIVLKSYDDPKEVSRIRINTEAQKGYNHVLNRIKELVLKLKKDSGDEPKKIGIGTPGTIDPTPFLYDNSLILLAGIQTTALLTNWALTPVDPALHEKEEEDNNNNIKED